MACTDVCIDREKVCREHADHRKKRRECTDARATMITTCGRLFARASATCRALSALRTRRNVVPDFEKPICRQPVRCAARARGLNQSAFSTQPELLHPATFSRGLAWSLLDRTAERLPLIGGASIAAGGFVGEKSDVACVASASVYDIDAEQRLIFAARRLRSPARFCSVIFSARFPNRPTSRSSSRTPSRPESSLAEAEPEFAVRRCRDFSGRPSGTMGTSWESHWANLESAWRASARWTAMEFSPRAMACSFWRPSIPARNPVCR